MLYEKDKYTDKESIIFESEDDDQQDSEDIRSESDDANLARFATRALPFT